MTNPRQLLLAVIAVLALASPLAIAHPSPPRICGAFVKAVGSIPPLPDLYRCVRQMNDKPYDPSAPEPCLASILASGYFEGGHIDKKEGTSSVFLDFVLIAPYVTVQKVNFDVEPSIQKKIRDWLRINGPGLEEGEPYDYHRDQRTDEIIHMALWDAGKVPGVTSNVTLDYRSGKAEATYRVSVGPDMTRWRALPPLEPECRIPILTFNRSGVDDYAPMDIIDKLTVTHAWECFDRATVARDQQALLRSELFTSANIVVTKAHGGKDILLDIKGKPLEVKEVRIAGYGLFAGKEFSIDPDFPLKPGDVYRRSLASDAIDYLQAKFARPGATVEAYESEQVRDTDKLAVTFEVFSYGWATSRVNGKQFSIDPSGP
jgi:hypothetical protein